MKRTASRRIRRLAPAALAAALPIPILAVILPAVPMAAILPSDLVVAPADDWTALFDRTSGWSGADGIYSIPLEGDDSPGAAAGRRTLFVFSDTFIGDVDDQGVRQDPTVMINNTAALLTGGVPDPDAIEFLYRTDGSGRPRSLVTPATPSTQPGQWYWLGDGVAIGGTLHVFALRMESSDEGLGFATAGIAVVSLPILRNPGVPAQTEAPLFLPADETRGEIIFGAGILDNTADGGAPFPDGYLYVYGTQNDPYVKKLVAARVRPETFLDFSTWEFLAVGGWTGDIRQVAPLAPRVSNELSVSPLPDGSGRYVLVYQEDAIGRYVAFRSGPSPVGPWSEGRRLWECPEPALDPDIYTYNAKAHPHLSRPGELLISYNVNTFDFWDNFPYADIYRPRFIRVTVSDPDSEEAGGDGADFALGAAPNPFNPRTVVSFALPAAGNVVLEVYDLAGRRVRTLLDGALPAGAHAIEWDGRDKAGRPAPAGVYLCRLQAGNRTASLRVSLVK